MELVPRKERNKYKVATRIERTRANQRGLYIPTGLLVVFVVALAILVKNALLAAGVAGVGAVGIAVYASMSRSRLDRWVETARQNVELKDPVASAPDVTAVAPVTLLEPAVNADQPPDPLGIEPINLTYLTEITDLSVQRPIEDSAQTGEPMAEPVAPLVAPVHEVVKPAASIMVAAPPSAPAPVLPQQKQPVVASQRPPQAKLSFLKGLFTRPVLGIDVGNSQIKIVELEQSNPPKILRYAIVPTPRGSVENGLIRRPDELSVAITEALMLGRFTTRRTATTLTGQNLMLRELRLPPMPNKEMRAAINWQIDQFLQLNKEDTLTDFSIMPSKHGEDTSVMLVAMQKEPIIKFVDYMKGTGFNVSRVDIEPLSVFRAAILATRGEVNHGVHLICDFGAGTTNISIFRDGLLQAARVITMGGNQMTRAIMVEHNLDFSQAEGEKIAHGLNPESPYYSSLAPVRDRLFSEISTTVNYFLTENKGLSIDTVQVAGGNAVLPSLALQLESHLRDALGAVNEGFKVNMANPLEHMVHEVPRAKVAWSGVALCVAIGLALGEV